MAKQINYIQCFLGISFLVASLAIATASAACPSFGCLICTEKRVELGKLSKSDQIETAKKKAEIACRQYAEKGFAEAQFGLSTILLYGKTPDIVKALMWMKLAANQEHSQAIKFLPLVKDYASPEQIEEAEKLAVRWRSEPVN